MNTDGGVDLIDVPNEANDKQPLRITYNRCVDADSTTNSVPPDGCPSKGDMNTDGNWDSGDVALFYAVYDDPAAASRLDYCRADVDGDGYVSVRDETCFLAAVAGHHAPVCSAPFCAFALPDEEEEGRGQNGPQGGGPQDYEAQLALLRAWDAANPRGAYPGLTDDEYQSMRFHVMADIGIISLDVAIGMDTFLAWRAANPRAAHPELTAAQWSQLVAGAYQTYVVSAEGISP